MTVDKETSTEILRLYHAEKWKIGTIARQLGVHHGTVRRVLKDAKEQGKFIQAAGRRLSFGHGGWRSPCGRGLQRFSADPVQEGGSGSVL